MAENEFAEVELAVPEEQQEEETPNPEPEQPQEQENISELPAPVEEGEKSFIQKVEAVPLGVMRSIENELKGEHWDKVGRDFKQHVVNPFEKNTLKILYWMSNKWDNVFGKPGKDQPAAEN